MKKRKYLITYCVVAVIAVAIALLTFYFEVSTYGMATTSPMHFLSDGFFTSAVLYLGCGALMFISEAGNFYGIQYLFYTMVRVFSFRKKKFESRKDYFTYCTEKKAAQKERGKSYLKWAMLFEGLGCLVLSILFAVLLYQIV